jgi:phosphorylcholine metabolism protein LicD
MVSTTNRQNQALSSLGEEETMQQPLSEFDRAVLSLRRGEITERYYEKLKEAAKLAAKREALLSLLENFDAYCSKRGVGYFLMADALCGVAQNADFLPGESDIEIGLLQPEFDNLCAALDEDAEQITTNTKSWDLYRYLDEYEYPNVRKRMPYLQLTSQIFVEYAGERFLDEMSRPIRINPTIELSIFNTVPEDYKKRSNYFSNMRKFNKLYEDALAIREKRKGKPSKKKTGALRTLRVSLVSLRSSAEKLERAATKYDGTNSTIIARVKGRISRVIDKTQLLPYQRLSFGGIEASCPADVSLWQSSIQINLQSKDESLRQLLEAAFAAKQNSVQSNSSDQAD